MLEKKKINLDVTKQLAETMTFEDKNGNNVVILCHLPYAEREQLILELAAMVLSADEETGICFENLLFDVVLNYLFVKYYTNIDVSDVNEVEDYQRLYDYCIVNEFDFFDICKDEYMKLMDQWNTYKDCVIRMYEATHSLAHVVKQMLNTDIDTNNKETRELIEKLIDMKAAYDEKQTKPVQVGGTVLNFAKKRN